MEPKLWVVNKSEKDVEICIQEMKKWITFKPFVPLQVPRRSAIDLQSRYVTISVIPDPEKYFEKRNMKQLIVRDAGLGDLLMVEPCARQLAINGNRDVSMLSRFPEIFENNPYLAENLKMDIKESVNIDLKKYDAWEDLRNYSETCNHRDTKHRTDCYNQVFQVNLDDPEPRLYFTQDEKPYLKKKSGKKYIGLVCDASHDYRRFSKWQELIDCIIEKDSDSIVVLIGVDGYMKPRRNKRIMDLQGQLTGREMIRLIRDLDKLVSVDSGPMHIGMSMHVPTVAIFSIIKPELRTHYYKGPFRIIYKSELPCAGCGSKHMADCRHGNKRSNKDFIPPCMNIPAQTIYDALASMNTGQDRRIFISKGLSTFKPAKTPPGPTRKQPGPTIQQSPGNKAPGIIHPRAKLTMPIMVQNEEKNLPRFIELVMKNPAIGKVIAIDGGSTDKTVSMLEKAGAFVYVNQYDPNYHDMQALQRNISCSFVRDGERIIIMDLDECFSRELSEYLPVLAESNIEYGVISRRTFKYYNDINDPEKQIKDYPDWQPRFYTWNRRFKFVGSPHHQTYNVPEPVKIKRDIIHFECEGKNRDALEKKWARMHHETKKIYS